MKFRPLHDRVLVRPANSNEKTAGGIIIPDSAQEKPMEGEVVAVGTGRITSNGDVCPLNVKPGDKIIFSKWGGEELTVDGEDFLVMSEEKIIGIVA